VRVSSKARATASPGDGCPPAMAGRTLGAALRDCAETFPQRIALTFQGMRLTYRDLLSTAATRAALLRDRGAGPGSRVAVYLERGPDLVISLMAAALAGSAQLAIDPDDPAVRVQRTLADATPQVLVTQSSLLRRLADGAAGREVVLITDGAAAAQQDAAVPDSPDDTAYLVYTSGSTGEPKASMIPHRALLSRLDWLQRRYQLTGDDRVLLKTACGFDVFVAELYWPLTSGATLVVAPPGGHRDPDYLAHAVLEEGVTTLHFVPTLLELFLAGRDGTERYDGLRRVLAGGEALTPELVRRFYARSSGTLHNLYGPSECAIYSTAWECPRDHDLPRVLIGGPVDGAELWVLGEDQRPVPQGAVGELYIGGDGVGSGYHARPGLTAERFLALTLEGSPRRVYRSGDLVRDVGGGQLEYLGRADGQIKIRGYRVEPGEIEVAILRTGQARAAAVVADSTGGRSRLVGFVVPDGDRAAQSLLDSLRQELPAYMVPAVIAMVDALPLSANGKVDRGELARRAGGIRPATDGGGTEPAAGNIGALAARLWREQLGVEHIGERDDFFRLGGDSMAAIQVVRRIAAELRHAVPARAMFDAPTLGEFIDYIAELREAE
jgi:amino acid adenylation domain-containing protein